MTIYQPFLDHAIATLEKHLDISAYPIPEGFDRKVGTTGPKNRPQEVITTSYGSCSPKLRQIRAAHVDGGNSLQVLNFVIFPKLAYDLPFFGADLVTLPGGHLIALDMQPLFHTKAYQAKYTDPLLETFQHFQKDLPWGGDFPEEAQQFFSPTFLWTRPSETEVVETTVFEAFKAYLAQYIEFVKVAQELPESERSAIKDAHIAYLHYRAEKDPARGMLTRFYGPEWTEEYIHGFLFDLERKLALQAA